MKLFHALASATALAVCMFAATEASALTVGFSQIGSNRLARRRNHRHQAGSREARRRPEVCRCTAEAGKPDQGAPLFIAQASMRSSLLRLLQPAGMTCCRKPWMPSIPVILLDRTVDSDKELYLTAVTSDLVHEGSVAGKWLVDETKGKDCNIVELQGTTGSSPPSTARRVFEQAIADAKNSRSSAARLVTSPAPRVRKSWKAS